MIDALKQRWQVMAMRLDAMSLRERVLIFLAVAGVALTLIFIGLIEPTLKRQEQMMLGVSGLQQEIVALESQILATEQQGKHGENVQAARLRREIETLQQAVKKGEAVMVTPAAMLPAMKSLLAAQVGLELVSLRTFAPQPVLEAQTGAGFDAVPVATPVPVADQIYRHGIELRLAGGYAELTRYLQKLESLPWAVQWQAMNLDASRHPRLELTLRFATLSREQTWAHF